MNTCGRYAVSPRQLSTFQLSSSERKKPMQRDSNATKPSPSRRGFLQTSATGGAALFAALGTNFAHAQGSDTIKVGLVGCGGRGTGAAGDVLNAAKNAKIDVKM